MTSAAPVTTYSRDNNANPRTSTVVRPDGVKTIQSAPGAGQTTEGWVNKTEVFAAGATTPSNTTITTYDGSAAVAYKSPRVTKIETTDERNQTLKTDFFYASGLFNQVTTACQYGYAGEKLRCVQTEYENSSNYIGQNAGSNHTANHIFNLVKASETVEANGTRVSRTEFEYDNNFVVAQNNHNLVNAPTTPVDTLAGFDKSHNPYDTTVCARCGGCTTYHTYTCGPQGQQCTTCVAWADVPTYRRETNFRGNVTKVRTFTDAANLTGAIDRFKQYDITGNVVKQNTDCCAQMNFTYDPAYNYAYPTRQTRGPAVATPDPNATNTAATYVAYDYYTGLPTYSKDANGLESTVQYNAANLRIERANSPTGAATTYFYNDAGMGIGVATFDAGGVLADKHDRLLNGLGAGHPNRRLWNQRAMGKTP